MLIPNTQIKLLKDILEDFELTTRVDDLTCNKIYQYLFSADSITPEVSDTNLLDTILALKDIVEMEQMTKLEDIIAFFENEDRAIENYMKDIIEELQSTQEPVIEENDFLYGESGICVRQPGVAIRPVLSQYVVPFNQYKHEFFAEEFKKYEKNLYEYLYFLLRKTTILEKRALIKDLVQDAALQAWVKYCTAGYKKDSIEKLLFITARSEFFNVLNKFEKAKALKIHYEKLSNHSLPSIENAFEASDTLKHLEQFTNKAELLILHQLAAGFTAKEIAQNSSLTLPNLKQKIQRYRQKLREIIKRI
jgi:DNA-directed RNA polymerase specialized sigma24 family protein